MNLGRIFFGGRTVPWQNCASTWLQLTASTQPIGLLHSYAKPTAEMFGYSPPLRRFGNVGRTSFDTWAVHGPCGVGYSTFPKLIVYREHLAMHSKFDRRVLSDSTIEFVRAVQCIAPCRLGGGSALAGAWLSHRLSRDLDLFFADRSALRQFLPELNEVASRAGGSTNVVRDSGTHVRATLDLGIQMLELDLVHDSLPDIGVEQPVVEGIQLVPFADLRASKLTCLLSRAEPRDLVDVLFLERAGHLPEADFELALAKDAGMDPSTLAWLIREIPVQPLPVMLEDLSESELAQYRDNLAERFKQFTIGNG